MNDSRISGVLLSKENSVNKTDSKVHSVLRIQTGIQAFISASSR